jgi:hypothetical protein
MRQLEDENARLKSLVADLTLAQVLAAVVNLTVVWSAPLQVSRRAAEDCQPTGGVDPRTVAG